MPTLEYIRKNLVHSLPHFDSMCYVDDGERIYYQGLLFQEGVVYHMGVYNISLSPCYATYLDVTRDFDYYIKTLKMHQAIMAIKSKYKELCKTAYFCQKHYALYKCYNPHRSIKFILKFNDVKKKNRAESIFFNCNKS